LPEAADGGKKKGNAQAKGTLMKASPWFITALALSGLTAGPALAEPQVQTMLEACKSELQKAGCSAKTEAQAHACLEKAEKPGEKNEGFSQVCHQAREYYEQAKDMSKQTKDVMDKMPNVP
jgi:hypothetical protein